MTRYKISWWQKVPEPRRRGLLGLLRRNVVPWVHCMVYIETDAPIEDVGWSAIMGEMRDGAFEEV